MSDSETIEGVAGPGRIGRVAAGDILNRSARRFANRIAVAEDGRHTTYAELESSANRFAHYLLSRGLRSGAKVATLCNNSTEMIVAIFGILKAGMVWVPINTMLGSGDCRYIAEHSGVSLAVIDDNIYANQERREYLSELKIAPIVNCRAGASVTGGAISFLQALEGQSDAEPTVDIGERDLAIIMYTSGTTSRPKGVMHCHLAVTFSAMTNALEWRLDRSDAVSGVLPLFHCSQHAILNYFLLVGGKIALQRGFDAEAVMKMIEREKLTVTVLLPMMYAAILNHPRRADFDLSSLRLCIWGMAPMPKDLTTRLVKEICPNFVLGSGQTEMYPSTTMSRPERTLERFGNYWGESTVINDTAIMDDEGNLLPPGQVGEIVHRGPNTMLGYYKDPASTAQARLFGWHHTGDLALVDEYGEILFIDRKKDLIKSGGENVSSVKVEEALLTHPAVQVAAAIGVPHPKWGESVAGFVQLKPGSVADEASIIDHCKTLLGGFQVPKLIRIIDKMPMTASGKIRKAELKEKFVQPRDGDQASG
jgi:long-chain acyl-CoA synthetase